MLWFKAFHIVFAFTWFAGLFYLPRLFVYHVAATDQVSRERFIVMERRLFNLMTVGGLLTVALAAALLILQPAYLALGWLHWKLGFVALVVIYHLWCRVLMRSLAAGSDTRSQRWYRWFNEVPSALLVAIVLLAVLKPA